MPTLYYIFLLIYIVPILSLIFYPLNKYLKYSLFHKYIGKIEWFFSFTRDIGLSLGVIIYLMVSLVLFLTSGGAYPVFNLFLLVFVALSGWSFFLRRKKTKEFLIFVSKNDPLPPAVFFKYYFASISLLPGRYPDSDVPCLSLESVESKNMGKIRLWPIFPGLFSTGILARLVVKSGKWFDSEFCEKIADSVGAVWGMQILRITENSLQVEGVENLKGIKGRSIFVSNHKSFLDFAILPSALYFVNKTREIPFKVKYLAARDHFIDNILLYRILGIGRALEKIGTIFVDRKAKKEAARDSIGNAAKSIVENGVDIMIYPQGTRAHGNLDKNGIRVESGYYTTGSIDRLIKDRGHIKKGAAYLAVDTAIALGSKDEVVNIIPVGLMGVGKACPKGSLKIENGVQVKVRFGKPMTLSIDSDGRLNLMDPASSEYSGRRPEMIHEVFTHIDERLKESIDLHSNLKKRLIIDIRKFMNEGEINSFLEAIDAWKIEENLIFSIIDCIYSCNSRTWLPFIRQLSGLLTETSTPKEDIINFKKAVLNEMISNR